MILSKNYNGKDIICEYDSSNFKKAIYNTETNKLSVTFGSGIIYEYDDIPHDIFAELNIAESQGKYFNKNISKNYSYRKI